MHDYLLDAGTKASLPCDPEDILDLPSTPHLYARSVAFIYRNVEGARKDVGFCAVGLIAAMRSAVESMHRYYYLVTNEHVVHGMGKVTVRLNGIFGLKVLTIPEGKFQTDKYLDLAIAALPEDSETSFTSASKEASVNAERIDKLKIGYGTDVFMVSRVVRRDMHYLQWNVSVMRFGNIALVPQCEEKFYLVEMRSISGHSGSPVFVYQTPFIFGNARKPEEEFAPMLLGINRGHVEESTEVLREDGGRLVKHPTLRSVTNMAISQVVPAWHIFDMLEGKKFKAQREKADLNREVTTTIIPDDQLKELFNIPKGKKKTFMGDGSSKIEDLTEEDKRARELMRSNARKLKSEP